MDRLAAGMSVASSPLYESTSKQGEKMISSIKSVVAFGAGFAGGWAARSLAESPQDVAVKALEFAMNAKERLDRWAADERERLEDMLAEARSRVTPTEPRQKTRPNGVV